MLVTIALQFFPHFDPYQEENENIERGDIFNSNEIYQVITVTQVKRCVKSREM